MVDYEKFGKWLRAVRGFGTDSSKDVVSRLKRVKNFIDFEKHKELRSTLFALDGNKDFKGLSVFVKSQLKRAVTLYHEFLG